MKEIIDRYIEGITKETTVDEEGNFIDPVDLSVIDTKVQDMIREINENVGGMFAGIELSDEKQLIINKLLILYYLMDEQGYKQTQNMPDENEKWKWEAQIRLSMLYLRLFREIIHLLQGGFASAALARIRAIYEDGVFLELISTNDNVLAENFLKHTNSSRLKFVKALDDNDPLVNKVRQNISNEFNYDDRFWKDYQWARTITNSNKITFKDLAELTDLWKYYHIYVMSCVSVHATIYDCINGIGLSREERGKSIWVTTPRENGFDFVVDTFFLFSGDIITKHFKMDHVNRIITNILMLNILNRKLE